ncbi:MAG: glycoside hydrolase family 127 protein [Chitinophagaceae bacterium]
MIKNAGRSKWIVAIIFYVCPILLVAQNADKAGVKPLPPEAVTIHDAFWSPKLAVWDNKTVYDVFDKLEGNYEPDRQNLIDEKAKWGRTRNAFLNFDRVAEGKKDINLHDGPPWYDGLVYESIRGAADLLLEYPDPDLEKRIDGYITRIAAAQAADPDGYINTYTTLMRSNQRWGRNGGDDKWQHDIYNAGMLVDAAVHYYNATGKTQLLNVAARFANYIYSQIGPAPKLNVIPGHGGPEEAMIKMYWLFKSQPTLKKKMSVPVDETQYYQLAKFWIEERGNYGEKDGSHSRNSDSSYNQDQSSVFNQQTIEGHAVRATLLATGVVAAALENHDNKYIQTANNYWNNMVGKRMFITGGEGAIADGERFGKDYYLPESAYLETCAAIGAGFFTQRMSELQPDGKYVDELERVLYNNLLSGISLTGDKYFYENPLIATDHKRWVWHDCPCCPPMILKMVGALPGFIYAQDADGLYVNLFIGSEAKASVNGNAINIKQETDYPWKGKTTITLSPVTSSEFTVRLRVPGWATGHENPYNLYSSSQQGAVVIKINGKPINTVPVNGYVQIKRQWRSGDRIEMDLPVQPRLVFPNDSIQTIKGKVAIAAGPVVYALESIDNKKPSGYSIEKQVPLNMSYEADLLNGVNIIKGKAKDSNGQAVEFTAVPFYSIGNRGAGEWRVWLNNNQ